MNKELKKGYLILGGNIPDREKYLELTVFLINEKIGKVTRKSRIYETEPWGVEGQMNYLNRVVEIETERSAEDVLKIALNIETLLGRVRTGMQYSSRTIDIDLLFYNNEVISNRDLILPHPRLHLRGFVLKPLSEIAADLIHPIFKKSVKELLSACPDDSGVQLYKR